MTPNNPINVRVSLNRFNIPTLTRPVIKLTSPTKLVIIFPECLFSIISVSA